ncbi:MAG: helix-hairpin-helix domain-containing protein [Phycisphaerales bacterium]|nr:helix-hairpin-helix domain-containing protein [Phycisphaerales bacterium]
MGDSSDPNRILRVHHRDGLTLVVGLFLATWFAGSASTGRTLSEGRSEPIPASSLKMGIDPNTAEWYEFAQLPGIGETVARRFEMFRKQRLDEVEPGHLVFERLSDLTLIRGIGEKTVLRIRPFLRLPNVQVDD